MGRGMGPISNEALQQSHLFFSEQGHATYKGDCAVSQKKMLLPGVERYTQGTTAYVSTHLTGLCYVNKSYRIWSG